MKALPAPGVLWQTLRHLRPRQILFQLLRRLFPGGFPSSPLPLRWQILPPKVHRSRNTERVFFDGCSSFNFNNEKREFSGDWNDPLARKLWLYNLHYMFWLFDLDEGREEWIRKWIWENPVDKGGNGWEPYPLSLRLFNWCKHYSLTGNEPDAEVLGSMGRQASCLLGRLEFNLDGNHLLENLFALAFVGFFLDESDPRNAKRLGHIQSLLESELSEQFLEDGGHFELSPMYHAILLERILDLLNFWPGGGDVFPGLKNKLNRVAMNGLDWLDTMSVGGRFSLFNDSAYDSAPDADLLLDYGSRLLGFQIRTAAPLKTLRESGYSRAEAGELTLIFDNGNLGPDHQMGHAQGDMLSFCLWLGERPVIVHPGNFEYIAGKMRSYCRSTASHNTLVINGGEQADWWASHRVGWRGRAIDGSAEINSSTGVIRVWGSHTGYSRLPGHPIHKREIEVSSSGIMIHDFLFADAPQRCRIYFHLYPDCEIESEGVAIRIRIASEVLTMKSENPMHVEDGWYCPEFGLKIRNKVICLEGEGKVFRTHLMLETGALNTSGAQV